MSGPPPPSPSFSSFSTLSDDIVLNIFLKLDSDPRHWARLACVSSRFSALIRHVCCRSKCFQSTPSVLADLLTVPDLDHPPGGWPAFHKLSVCCPGLVHAGVLLENSDFGLEREIGPDRSFPRRKDLASSSDSATAAAAASDCAWSLFDDLYFDTVYDSSESVIPLTVAEGGGESGSESGGGGGGGGWEFSKRKRGQCGGGVGAHLASMAWNLSREQGNKLLASRFRGDCLYICDWPGCVHAEEKRKYMLFRGVFKDFKRSRVWRTINDAHRSKLELDCAFCPCKETWDLHSAFCLRRVFGYHDDGEPVVRAYVCENGHVSGAWTERPLYT